MGPNLASFPTKKSTPTAALPKAEVAAEPKSPKAVDPIWRNNSPNKVNLAAKLFVKNSANGTNFSAMKLPICVAKSRTVADSCSKDSAVVGIIVFTLANFR